MNSIGKFQKYTFLFTRPDNRTNIFLPWHVEAFLLLHKVLLVLRKVRASPFCKVGMAPFSNGKVLKQMDTATVIYCLHVDCDLDGVC